MHADACRDRQGQLAAWILDQLDDAEAEELVAHLADCDPCQGAAAELTQSAVALSAADPAHATADEPPARLGAAVAGRLAAERAARRRRWAAAAAAVALAVMAAAATIAAWPTGDDAVPVELVEAPAGVEATVDVRDYDWGSTLRLEAEGLEDGTVYEVWVEDAQGRRHAGGSFIGIDGRINCYMTASARLDDAALIGVDGPDGAAVLRGHPTEG